MSIRELAKKYDRKVICGYTYIEHPFPEFDMFSNSEWLPHDSVELFDALKPYRLINIGFFYDKRVKKYYVIDHLWIASLVLWPSDQVLPYVREIFSRMLKNVEEVIEEVEAVKPKINMGKFSKLPVQQKIMLDVIVEDFEEKHGMSYSQYNAIKDKCDTFKLPCQWVEIMKFWYAKYGAGMNKIYMVLKDKGIIYQPHDKVDGFGENKYNVLLTEHSINNGYGSQDEGTVASYPRLSPKGLFTISMILVDAGLIAVPAMDDVELTL